VKVRPIPISCIRQIPKIPAEVGSELRLGAVDVAFLNLGALIRPSDEVSDTTFDIYLIELSARFHEWLSGVTDKGNESLEQNRAILVNDS